MCVIIENEEGPSVMTSWMTFGNLFNAIEFITGIPIKNLSFVFPS